MNSSVDISKVHFVPHCCSDIDKRIKDVKWEEVAVMGDETEYKFEYEEKCRGCRKSIKILIMKWATLIDEESDEYSVYIEAQEENCLIVDYTYK